MSVKLIGTATSTMYIGMYIVHMYVRTYICIFYFIFIYLFRAYSITSCNTTCLYITLRHLYSIYIFGLLFTHWLCTVCSFTVFHSRWNWQNLWTVLSIFSLTHFSLLATCLLLRCTLLVFLFHCSVCCSHRVCGPLFDFRWGRCILGTLIILNRCRYDLVFPWAVIIVVTLGVRLTFIFSLSLMFEKNSLVAYPLVVWSHCCC